MKKEYKEKIWKTVEVLSVACCIDRQKGYTNTSSYFDGDQSQRWNNKEMLTFHFYPELAARGYDLKFKPNDDDLETAEAIIKYFRRLSFGIMADNINDYLSRVFKLTQNEDVAMSDFGVIASVPNLYQRELKAKDVRSQMKDAKHEHFGEINQSVTLEIRYLSTKYIPKLNCFAHNAVTSSEHLVSFLNKIELGTAGSVQKIRARIKSHGQEWNSKLPETQLNYVKVVDTVTI